MARSTIKFSYADAPTLRRFAKDDSFVRLVMGPFGCLHGATNIITHQGPCHISRMKSGALVLTWDAIIGDFIWLKSSPAHVKGRDYLYEVEWSGGRFAAAAHHRVMAPNGLYIRVGDLRAGDDVGVARDVKRKEQCHFETGSIERVKHRKFKDDYWDIHVPGTNNYVTEDGSIHHNSGKSSACVAEIVRRAQQMPIGPEGKRISRWAVVRNTFPQLRDTTIPTFHEWLPPQYYGNYRVSDHDYIIDRLHPDILLEIRFRALDRPEHVANLLGAEYTGAWVNESREVERGIIDSLTGRVGRFPKPADVPGYWSGIIMDTNPPDTDNWIYTVFEEDRPEGYRIFKQPPGDGPKAENLNNLRPDYYQRLKIGKDKDWIKVYVHGEYGFTGSGKPVYPEYQDSVHVAEDVIAPSDNYPIYIGVDWGLTPAAVFTQLTSQRWVVLKELTLEDGDAVTFVQRIKLVLASEYRGFDVRVWGDPSGEDRAQTDRNTPFAIFNANGLPAEPAYTPGANYNDFTIRRAVVAKRLTTLAFDGQPQLLISPDCTKLRRGMSGGYKFRRMAYGGSGTKFKDVPDKGPLSHVCESLQHLLVGAGESYEVIRRADVEEEAEDVDDGRIALLGADAWMGM